MKDLFNRVPPTLFRPLAAPLASVYWQVLLQIFQLMEDYGVHDLPTRIGSS